MSKIITGVLGQVSDGTRVRQYLMTTDPYHDASLANVIEYGTALPVIPGNAGLNISEQITFQPQGGTSNVSVSQIPLINTEGYFDDWGGYIISGLSWTIKRGYADQAWSEWKTLLDGRGRGKPEFMGREKIVVSLRDRFGYMRQPVATDVFGEDDVTNESLINQTVPMVFGSAYQVDPLLSEPNILRYAVASNLNDVPRVQEGGNPSTPIFEYVPNGFQLYASPTLEITCDVSGPAVEGWEASDVLSAIGDFGTWTSGYPDGWDVTEDSPFAVISETSEGWASIENTAKIDGDTGWVTAATYVSETNPDTGDAWLPTDTDLAASVEADDGDYAALSTGDTRILRLTGTDWTFGLTPDVEPVGVEVRTIWENTAGTDQATRPLHYMLYPDGTTRSLQPGGQIYPATKETDDIGSSTSLPIGLTKAILEDPEFALVTTGRRVGTGVTGCRIYQLALKIHYGTVVDRLRLTTQANVMTAGNRYLLRLYMRGGSGDSIKGYWGGVQSHSDDIPTSDNPYAQTSSQLEGEETAEFSFIASGPKFAIEFDRGDGNGEQVIEKIELIDQSASRETYKELQRYLHETAGEDPDELCDNDSLELVETQANNPRLGWYVDDEATREQVATILSHSLGAVSWGGADGKWKAAQMRIPQQPSGEYLSVIGSYEAGRASPDMGKNLRDRVHAAKNVKPLRESETAGVTTTWPEEQRQLVISDWRITEKADPSDLVGYLSVDSISPSSGTTAGGTSVTISGTGFTDSVEVTIGGERATSVTVNSSTELTCDTPAGSAGDADVAVSIGTVSATLTDGYTYS